MMYTVSKLLTSSCALIATLTCLLPARQALSTEPETPKAVVEFLETTCLSCHNEHEPKAGFRIDEILAANSMSQELVGWNEILTRLEARDMPPASEPRPTEEAYTIAVESIGAAIEKIEDALNAQRPKAMRRLNREEYANTIRDLLGIPFRAGEDFPSDVGLHGFDTVAAGLHLSPDLVEKHLIAASAAIERALRHDVTEHQPRVTRAAFYEEHHRYPPGTALTGLGVYNGNAHMAFGPAGQTRVVYIGGPALFSYQHIDAINNPAHAFNSEGLYKLKATLTPRNFVPGEVASFTVLGTEKRFVSSSDVTIIENGKSVTVEAECYYDRADSLLGFELQWTNGNFLQAPSRGHLLSLPFDNSDQNKPWWHVNYRIEEGKRIEWKPNSPEELPFSYFEQIEFEMSGPIRHASEATSRWLGEYRSDHDAAKVFKAFLPRAFRRSVTAAEIDSYVKLVQMQRAHGLDAIEALKVGMCAALCSPHFLLMVETQPTEAISGSNPLNDSELATRLSYFLWASCPDDELLRLAVDGQLATENVLNQQVVRMIADSKANAFVNRFTRQWLNLDKLATTMPEPKLFPIWTDDLRDSCRAETLEFVREILIGNRPITDFLSSDWTFVNEELAAHYELPSITGRTMRKTHLPDGHRGGLLTQASILTLTSEATRTAPVVRGAYVLDRIFNRPPPPPPANVGALIPDASQAKSVREHLMIHRADSACAGCHAKFDGFGLALENFDATGRWRSEERAFEDPAKPVVRQDGQSSSVFKIDASVEMADGSKFDGIGGMKSYLLSRKEDFVRGLTERLLIYACGRELTRADKPHVDAIVQTVVANDYRSLSLLQAIVASPPFRTR